MTSLEDFDRKSFEEGSVSSPVADWSRVVLDRLLERAFPPFERRVRISTRSASLIRIPALVLAAEARHAGRRAAAAMAAEIALGAVLLQSRPYMESELEGIVLASSL
jgi:hypothetical protein